MVFTVAVNGSYRPATEVSCFLGIPALNRW